MLEAVKHLPSFSTLFRLRVNLLSTWENGVPASDRPVLVFCQAAQCWGEKVPQRDVRPSHHPRGLWFRQPAHEYLAGGHVVGFLLAAPPQSWGCAGRHSKASFDSKHGLQVLPHAARCDKDTRQKPKLEKKQSRGLQGQSGCCLWCHCDLHQSRWSGLTVVHASYQDRMISLKFNGLAVIMWSNVSFFSSVLIWLLTSFLTRIRRICIGRK